MSAVNVVSILKADSPFTLRPVRAPLVHLMNSTEGPDSSEPFDLLTTFAADGDEAVDGLEPVMIEERGLATGVETARGVAVAAAAGEGLAPTVVQPAPGGGCEIYIHNQLDSHKHAPIGTYRCEIGITPLGLADSRSSGSSSRFCCCSSLQSPLLFLLLDLLHRLLWRGGIASTPHWSGRARDGGRADSGISRTGRWQSPRHASRN